MIVGTSIAGKSFEICWVNPDSFCNACIWKCGKLLQWFIQFISPIKLGDIKLGRLDLSTVIHPTFFTLIAWDFFSSCWVGWEFSDLLSWGVMSFQFSMSDILLQSLTLKKKRVYVLCVTKCLAYYLCLQVSYVLASPSGLKLEVS